MVAAAALRSIPCSPPSSPSCGGGAPLRSSNAQRLIVEPSIESTALRGDFSYNQEADVCVCPAGKVLTSTGTLANDGETLLYRASKYDCDACELKPRCCPKMPARKVPRSIYENARDVARDIAKTETYVTSRRERRKIEMLFAHLKRILRLDRLRLRGPFGVQGEFLLAATAQNDPFHYDGDSSPQQSRSSEIPAVS